MQKKKAKIDEGKYIIGLDLGQRLASISYLDQNTLKPLTYDLSGGYGDTAVPLILQYLIDEKTFLIGADAQLNQYQEGTQTRFLMEVLSLNETVHLGEEAFEPSALFGIFIGKILDSFKGLNPNAVIESICIAIEDGSYLQLKDLILEGMRSFSPIKVHVIRASEAILQFIMTNKLPIEDKVCLLDYSYLAITSLILEKKDSQVTVSKDRQDSRSALKPIEAAFRGEIEQLYKQELNQLMLTDGESKQIDGLFNQNLMAIFQKHAKEQGHKIYFNFAYPPFQKVLSYGRMLEILEPFVAYFEARILQLTSQNIPVILVGQGFKMIWPQRIVKNHLTVIESNIYEGVSKGSCLVAAADYLDLFDLDVREKEFVAKTYGLILENTLDTLIPMDEEEQMILVDFKEKEVLKLCLISQGHLGSQVVEVEKFIQRMGHLDGFVRFFLRIEHLSDGKVDLTVEHLPM